eukprot:TRINITY_DN7195_c0_g1_i1.p1 TRINITY_DN7195_c0_g1~~TRINITY_DN7195_c0_g1_i1.p1  ORF type:complete len:1271 (-),score=203.54 TRINITY_DN7195_c0_g1_i1:50-3862(-)
MADHPSLPQRPTRKRVTQQAEEDGLTASGNDALNPSPWQGIVPKEETQVAALLRATPQHNGTGIVVGVIDTGVDVGAEGLQTTPDGRRKVIASVDCTGAGDVDTSTVVTADAATNTVRGLTGRVVQIGERTNPSRKYHLGKLRVFDLFPKNLVQRLKSDRRKAFEAQQEQAAAALQAEIGKCADETQKQDLQQRLEELRALMQKYEDFGPVVDVVVFHDGNVWRSLVDVDGSGDLRKAEAMTDFHREGQRGVFGWDSLLHFTVNIYADGALLSVVVPSGTHGTHVAGIVAAHYPLKPEHDGIAPGVQLVSCQIGDVRLNCMETGVSLARAVIAVRQFGCHVVNLSFGESSQHHRGRVLDFFKRELCNTAPGITVFTSAGNDGPALSTVGAPEAAEIVSVGAYATESLAQAVHALRDTLPESSYTFTSAGPANDGARVVSISAPGAAISPVPQYTLHSHEPMMGTSMASPNCCGAVALILSALQAASPESALPSPYTIRRALEHTARAIPGVDPFRSGCGLIQAQAALEYLQKSGRSQFENVAFHVTVPSRNKSRGLYLRTFEETSYMAQHGLRVKPVFNSAATVAEKVAFSAKLELKSSAAWVKTPQFVVLQNSTKFFSIDVDPTQLPSGLASFAEIVAVDATNTEAAPVFRFPITVIRPLANPTYAPPPLVVDLTQGEVARRFLHVPTGATACCLRLLALGNVPELPPRDIRVQILQIQPDKRNKDNSVHEYFRLTPYEPQAKTVFAVDADAPMEIALCQPWSSPLATRLQILVEFLGLSPVGGGNVAFVASGGVFGLTLHPSIRSSEVDPSFVLKRLKRAVAPQKSEITPLAPTSEQSRQFHRDRIPSTSQNEYELCLTYEFALSDKVEVLFELGSQLSGVLYESPVEGCLIEVTEKSTGRHVTWQDAFYFNGVRMDAGDYVATARLRHDQVAVLQTLQSTPLSVSQKLEKELSLDVYRNLDEAQRRGKKLKKFTVKPGAVATFFVSSLATADSWPKDAAKGDVFIGQYTLRKGSSEELKVEVRPFTYLIDIKPTKAPDKARPAVEPEQKKQTSEAEKLQEHVLAETVSYLKKKIPQIPGHRLSAEPTQSVEDLLLHTITSYPDHLPLLRLLLQYREATGADTAALVEAADKILGLIPVESVAAAGKSEQRDALIEALHSKTLALFRKAVGHPEAAEGAMSAFQELSRWVDTEDAKYAHVLALAHLSKGRIGEALHVVVKHTANHQPTSIARFELIRELVGLCGWSHWGAYFVDVKAAVFPKAVSDPR